MAYSTTGEYAIVGGHILGIYGPYFAQVWTILLYSIALPALSHISGNFNVNIALSLLETNSKSTSRDF